MNLFIVRDAEISDLDDLARLFNNYRIFYRQTDDILLAKKFLAERLEYRDSVIFVARSRANELLGFVQLYPILCSIRGKIGVDIERSFCVFGAS